MDGILKIELYGQAYLVLAQKVHIRSLQINQRVRLLMEGLNDRSDVVKVAVQKNLLNSWLRFVNGSILELLTCLDVEASTTVAEIALDAIFSDMPASALVQKFDLLDDNKLIPTDKLKPESVLYWKTLAKHLKYVTCIFSLYFTGVELALLIYVCKQSIVSSYYYCDVYFFLWRI